MQTEWTSKLHISKNELLLSYLICGQANKGVRNLMVKAIKI